MLWWWSISKKPPKNIKKLARKKGEYIRRELYASLPKTDIKRERESEIARTTILYLYTSPFLSFPLNLFICGYCWICIDDARRCRRYTCESSTRANNLFLSATSFFLSSEIIIIGSFCEFWKKSTIFLWQKRKYNFFSLYFQYFSFFWKNQIIIWWWRCERIKRYAFRELLRCVSDSQISTFRFKLNVHLTSDTKLMVRNFPKKKKDLFEDKVYK